MTPCNRESPGETGISRSTSDANHATGIDQSDLSRDLSNAARRRGYQQRFTGL